MGERENGWTTVGHRPLGNQLGSGRQWVAQQELTDLEAIAAWDNDAQWPSM